MSTLPAALSWVSQYYFSILSLTGQLDDAKTGPRTYLSKNCWLESSTRLICLPFSWTQPCWHIVLCVVVQFQCRRGNRLEHILDNVTTGFSEQTLLGEFGEKIKLTSRHAADATLKKHTYIPACLSNARHWVIRSSDCQSKDSFLSQSYKCDL